MPQIAKATKRALSKTKNVFRIAWDPIDPPLRLMSPLKQLCCFKKNTYLIYKREHWRTNQSRPDTLMARRKLFLRKRIQPFELNLDSIKARLFGTIHGNLSRRLTYGNTPQEKQLLIVVSISSFSLYIRPICCYSPKQLLQHHYFDWSTGRRSLEELNQS